MITQLHQTDPRGLSKIDWTKPQVLKKTGKSGYFALVMSSGEHEGSTFQGQVIFDNKEKLPIGRISNMFYKSQFTPCAEPITITFTNSNHE